MQKIASQRFVSHHETAVASFDIGDHRPRFEGRLAKGSRPPHALDLLSFDSNPEPNPQNLHRGEAIGPPELIERLRHLPGGGLRSCGVPPEGPADHISK